MQSLSSNFLEETVTRAHTVPSAFCPGVLIPSPYSFSSDCCENQPSLEIFALTLSVWAVLWVFFFFSLSLMGVVWGGWSVVVTRSMSLGVAHKPKEKKLVTWSSGQSIAGPHVCIFCLCCIGLLVWDGSRLHHLRWLCVFVLKW